MTVTTVRATLTRRIDKVDVYKGSTRTGVLARTEHGAVFRYAPEYVARATDDSTFAIAFRMSVRAEPYEVFGTNLQPFFAGLLPEGLRMKALVRALKTSEDDLFSLLVASGADTVGDVAVALPDTAAPSDQAPVADTRRLATLSFAELLEYSLSYHDNGTGGDASIAGVQPKVSAAMISFPNRRV